jgi:hypothetical protein
MKNVSKILGTLTLFGTFAALPLTAQMEKGIDFTTSFPFYVDGVEVPAGSYQIRPDINAGLLRLQSADDKQSMFVPYIPTETLNPAAETQVIFHEYAGIDYLNGITITGDTSGIEVPPGKNEKAAAQAAKAHGEQASLKKVKLGSLRAGN